MLPSRLVMENFFSHKNTEVDFSDFNSALLIGNSEGDYRKSNGAGKSAIFEAIVWALFNKSRVAMMDDVIKWGELSCKVSLEFLHDGKTYKVTRTRFAANSTTTIELKTIDSFGDWKDISGSTSGETNQRIEDIIKLDYRTFINSTYFRQNDISEFAESEASKKKEILKSIIDLSRWDSYEKASKSKAKELAGEVKILQTMLQDYDSVVQSITQVKIDSENTALEISQLEDNKSKLEESLSASKSTYESIKQSLDTAAYDKLTAEIASLKELGKSTSAKLKSKSESVKNLKSEVDEARSQLTKISEKITENIDQVDSNILPELNARLTYHKSKFMSLKKDVEKIIEQKDKFKLGVCPTCNQDITGESHKHLIGASDEELENIKKELQVEKIEADSINSQIESINKKIEKNRSQEKLIQSREMALYRLSLVEKKYLDDSAEVEDMSKEISSIKERIDAKIKLLDSIKNDDFQSLRKKINELENEIKGVNQKISEKDKLAGRLQERESVLESRMASLKDNKEKLDSKLQKISVFEKLTKLLSKTGIQTLLLESVIQDLEKTSNNILNHICNEPAAIVLETQRAGSDGVSVVETLDLKVRKDGGICNFKSLSGGEQFRISLSLRIAMSEISSKYGGSSLEFLLLDEVNSPLDRYGVETLFLNVIKSLEDRYKILIITHDESLKEKFDNVINVTKINGESEVAFVAR